MVVALKPQQCRITQRGLDQFNALTGAGDIFGAHAHERQQAARTLHVAALNNMQRQL